MAEPIGALRVELSAGHAQFEADMKKARDAAKRHGSGISDEMKKVGQTFDQSMKSIFNVKNALGALIGAASLAGFASLIKHSIESADKMYKLAQSVGVPVSELSALSYAANLSGTDVESLGKSLGKLSKSMMAAAAGSGDAKDAFSALGISVIDSNGRLKSSTQVLGEVADRFKKYEDGAGKTAMAMKIFGKAGAEMIPMLNQGSDGIERMRLEAEKLGLVMSEETGKAAEELQDNFERLQMIQKGLVGKIRNELVPSLTELTEGLIETAKETEALDKASKIGAAGVRILATAGVATIAVFKTLGDVVGDIAALLANKADAYKAIGTLIVDMSAAAGKALKGDLSEANSMMSKAWDDYKLRVKANEAAAAGLGENISDNFKSNMKGTWDTINKIWSDGHSNLTPPKDADEKLQAPIIEAEMNMKQAIQNLMRLYSILDTEQKNFYNRQGKLLDEANRAGLIGENEYIERKKALDVAAIEDEITRMEQLVAAKEKVLRTMGGTKIEKQEVSIDVEATKAKLGELRKDLITTYQVQTIQDAGAREAQRRRIEDYDQEIKAIRTVGDEALKQATSTNDEAVRAIMLVEQKNEVEKLTIDLKRKVRVLGEDELAQIEKLKEKHREINRLYDKQVRLKEDWISGLKKGVADYYEQVSNSFELSRQFVDKTFKSMEDALVDFCETGKLDFQALANSILKDMTRLFVQMMIMKPMMQGLFGMGGGLFEMAGGASGMFFAKGGVLNAGHVTPLARGGVVAQPTIFPMAHGLGLMGERGPEGVLPLARTASGDLGVKTAGGTSGGGNLVINVPVSVAERNPKMQSDLRKEIESTVEKVVRRYS